VYPRQRKLVAQQWTYATPSSEAGMR
jgi:hypothetical protein